MAKQQSFDEVMNAAIRDFTENGFDEEGRLEKWLGRIRAAATRQAGSEAKATKLLKEGLVSLYRRMVERGTALQSHPGVSLMTIQKLKPELRAELDRRILASANLIKLNRKRAIDQTLQRFSGWSTSIPRDGARKPPTKEDVTNLKKPMQSLPFEQRRVLTDQGHKFSAALSNIVAEDGGAIALIWNSNWRQPGYDYREDHKERDGVVYLIRDSWAHKKGFVKAGDGGYYDRITAVAEEPFCRCFATYIYNLRDLPKSMVTEKGRKALEEARAKLKAE